VNLTFVRVNQAIYYTLEYYELGRIKSHVDRFSNPQYSASSSELLDIYYKNAYDHHQWMDDEITQTVLTSNANAQAYLFVLLKEWLLDWRIIDVNRAEIFRLVNEYNERTEENYNAKIAQEDYEFRQSPDYGREHLEELEEPKQTIDRVANLFFQLYPPEKKVFKKFICRLQGPELIDWYLLPQYFNLVDEIISNFRRIINKHVALYDAKLIGPGVDKITERIVLPQAERPALPPSSSKIKVALSVPQLTYLFKMLYEVNPDIFIGLSKEELYRFISANFLSKAKGEDDEISTNKLKNLFYDTSKDVANFWVDLLTKMLQQSRKV
jgi:hypothetical protein